MNTSLHKQSGVMLLEALIGILIFSLGILALVGMQAAALHGVADARYRTIAANYANQLMQQISLNVTYQNDDAHDVDPTSITNFICGSSSDCTHTGGGSGSAIDDWASAVAAALPGATAAMQQVKVDTTTTAGLNQVTITVSWQSPEDPVARKHILMSYIN